MFLDEASDVDVETCDTKIDTSAITGNHYGESASWFSMINTFSFVNKKGAVWDLNWQSFFFISCYFLCSKV